MRGREHELRLAGDCLREAAQGQGQVLLIEGEPGIGKSALLAEVAGLAGHRGFTLAAAAADELGQLMAFAPLIAALPESPGDLAGAASVSAMSGTAPAARGPAREFVAAGFGVIQGLVERRASAGPVLISLDDLHWADPATLTALRVLPRRLATRRLAWVLARRTAADGGGAGLLFDLLEKEGAARITLGPLTSEAVAALLSDVLGARPGRDLTALAAAAAGQPFLLTELLRGLTEAGTVRVSGQTATLTGTELPGRLHTAAQRRLGELTGRTRTLLEIMAVLGDSFQLDDAADMLGEPPAGLLPLVNEALAAGILIAGGQAFSFRQPLLWRAVAEAVPVPARHALHRQFGEILLGRGDSALTAASYLVEGARRGDPAATAGLDQAVAEVVGSAPYAAADLAVRAIELTLPDDADWYPRLVRAADVLTAAARLDEAAGLVRDALAQPLPTAYRAQLRAAESAVLSLQGRPAEANAAAQTVLASAGVPGPVRDEAVVAQLQALSALGDIQRARVVAQDVLARPAEHGEPALAGALTVLGAICWADGQLGQGLQLCREAARRAGRISPDARHFQPLLVLAARLIDLRQFEEASAILRGAAGAMQAPGQHPAEPIPRVLRARADLAQGRTGAARAAADAALGLAGSLRAHPQTALARSVLSVIAFRAGDLRAAGQHLRGRPNVAHFTDSYAGTETMLARAQFVEAAAGPEKAAQLLGDLYAGLGGHRQVLTGDPAAAAWLARTALAAGSRSWPPRWPGWPRRSPGIIPRSRSPPWPRRTAPAWSAATQPGWPTRRPAIPIRGPGPPPPKIWATCWPAPLSRPTPSSSWTARWPATARPGPTGTWPGSGAGCVSWASGGDHRPAAARVRLDQSDPGRGGHLQPGRPGPEQSAGRGADVCERTHRRVSPTERVPQARPQLPGGTGPGDGRARGQQRRRG